jgi:hypothetical protein
VTKVPLPKTLEKYGLTSLEFVELADSQGHACAVCGTSLDGKRANIDHEHVKGWRHMPPERRKTFVRGLVCHWCNRAYLGRSVTIRKARAVVAYLEAYEARKFLAVLEAAKAAAA